MKVFLMRLRAEEPLIVTSGSSQSMAHETLDHIPGSMLLGAFVEVWKRRHKGVVPDDDPVFRALFLEGKVSWGCAVPACGGRETMPVPLCYVYPKGGRGLPAEGAVRDPKKHAVVNVSATEAKDDIRALLAAEGLLREDEAYKPKKLKGGFFDPQSMRLAPRKRGWNMHVSLDTQRSAVESQLFGYSSIAPGAEFLARIQYEPEMEKELASLLEGPCELRVGHCRSAGCGRLSVHGVEPAAPGVPAAEGPAGCVFTLFLQSHYVPRHTWEKPMAGLLAELSQVFGALCTLERGFADYYALPGWNSLWRKPRATRTALCQGSVLRVRMNGAGPVAVPAAGAFGAEQREGCGRVLFNPAFLQDKLPAIPDLAPEKGAPQAGTAPAAGGSAVWKVLRLRAVRAVCEDFALSLLNREEWRGFVRSVAEREVPSASQRGGLRAMVSELEPSAWLRRFKHVLDTTVRRQWETAFCLDPWTRRNEELTDAMERILDPEKFASLGFDGAFADVPGGALDDAERSEALALAHRIFMVRLLSDWGSARRDAVRKGGM